MLSKSRGDPGICLNVTMSAGPPAAGAAFVVLGQSEYAAIFESDIVCIATAILFRGLRRGRNRFRVT